MLEPAFGLLRSFLFGLFWPGWRGKPKTTAYNRTQQGCFILAVSVGVQLQHSINYVVGCFTILIAGLGVKITRANCMYYSTSCYNWVFFQDMLLQG